MNPVLVDGKIPPKVKRDAHDIILDFIRSRPPLKPVSNTNTILSLFMISLLAGFQVSTFIVIRSTEFLFAHSLF